MAKIDNSHLRSILPKIMPHVLPDIHASGIIQDTNNRFASDSEKSTWNGKQNALVSGTNIKTINSSSIIGSGNIAIGGEFTGDMDDIPDGNTYVKTENNYSDDNASKLAAIEEGANNYTHPANHSPSIITQDSSNRFVSDTEKGTWNGKEPGNSNIQAHVTSAHLMFSGLTKITVGTQPSNPSVGDLWVDTT